MHLKKLFLKNFRNFADLSLEINGSRNIFAGPNGSGKTNILEAIHLLCTARSQRNASRNEMIRFHSCSSQIYGEFEEENEEQERKRFSIVFDRQNGMSLKINERKISTISEWFGIQPIVSFAADDIELVYGNPEIRRRFLDMFISLTDKMYLQALFEYRKNLLSRNKLLKTGIDEALCDIYEKNMADAAKNIIDKRTEACVELNRIGREMYGKISGKKDDFSLVYKPNFSDDISSKNSWEKVFYTMLTETRKRDQLFGFSSCGPHRDDLLIFMNEKAAKNFASQGQCRSIAVSLKLSSMECIEKKANNSMLLIFDDAVADLDRERAARLFSLIENRGQLFMASPQKNTNILADAHEYVIREGRLMQA